MIIIYDLLSFSFLCISVRILFVNNSTGSMSNTFKAVFVNAPFVILNNSELAQSVILEALPILLGEMERKTYKPKNQGARFIIRLLMN